MLPQQANRLLQSQHKYQYKKKNKYKNKTKDETKTQQYNWAHRKIKVKKYETDCT
jgi:hypothetical protein